MQHELRAELIQRSQKDQEMRNRSIGDMSQWDDSVDKENTAWLEDKVRLDGLPTISDVGEEASQAAWLLVQHADYQPDFQKDCLAMMKHLPKGEIKPADIAYLEDRIRVAGGKPQLYGTQFYKEGGYFRPRPIEDEAHLGVRRVAMGLEPFETSRQRVIDLYGNMP